MYGQLKLFHSGSERAAKAHDLASVNRTLPGERDQTGLRLDPAGQC